MMETCYLCWQKKVVEILDVGPQPVSHRFLHSMTEDEYTHPIILGLCEACGLLQMLTPMPSSELMPRFDWLTSTEPEAHLDQLVETICSLPGITKDSVICGISWKEDTTLERFNQLGYQNTWRVDPKEDLGIQNPLANVETIQECLTPETAMAITSVRGEADVVIARHLIEHALDVRQFMKAVRSMVHPKGYVIFEIPDCLRALEKLDYTTIWEEHTLYFTPETFRNCFGFGGLSLVHFEKAPYPLEDSYIGIAQPKEDLDEPLPSEKILRNEIDRARNFANALHNQKKKLKKFLSEYRRQQGKVALFGAAHMACVFINLLELKDHIEFVVDDNPHKKNLYMPSSRLPIMNSSAILEKNIKLCLLTLSAASEEKVIQNNQEYLVRGGHFYSIFPGNPLALSI